MEVEVSKNRVEKLLKAVDIYGQLEPEDARRIKNLFKRHLKTAFDYGWCARAQAQRKLGKLWQYGTYITEFETQFKKFLEGR